MLNPELDQDRTGEAKELFDKYGYVMFPQQRAIYSNIATRLKGQRVLEAGCGDGIGASILHRQVYSVIGTDKMERNILFAREMYPWIEFHVWDITTKPFLESDVVVCIETLEHISNYHSAMANLVEAARKELWISTPNAAVRKQPPENPFHVKEFTPEEMLDLIFLRFYKPRRSRVDTVTIYNQHLAEVPKTTQEDPLVYRVELKP